jgi:hypothetical protein
MAAFLQVLLVGCLCQGLVAQHLIQSWSDSSPYYYVASLLSHVRCQAKIARELLLPWHTVYMVVPGTAVAVCQLRIITIAAALFCSVAHV